MEENQENKTTVNSGGEASGNCSCQQNAAAAGTGSGIPAVDLEAINALTESYSEAEEAYKELYRALQRSDRGFQNNIILANDASQSYANLGTSMQSVGNEAKDTESNVIADAISMLSTATDLYGIFQTLSKIPALSSLSSLFPYLAGGAAAVGGIALLFEATDEYNKILAEASIDDHFGEITISLQALEDAAETVVNSGNLGKIKEAVEVFGELEGIDYSIDNAEKKLSESDWKVMSGIGLDENEVLEYQQNADDYFASNEEYLLTQQYAASMRLSEREENPETSSAVAAMNEYHSSQRKELNRLTLNAQFWHERALADGVIDEIEVGEMTRSRAAVENFMASIDGSSDNPMDVIMRQYRGAEYSDETYANMSTVIDPAVDAAKEILNQDYAQEMQGYRVANEAGGLTDDELKILQADMDATRLQEGAAIDASVVQLYLDMLNKNYGAEVDGFDSIMQEMNDEWIGEYLNSVKADPSGNHLEFFDDFISGKMSWDMDESKRAEYNILFGEMKNDFLSLQESVRQYQEMGMAVPEELQNALYESAVIGAIGGDEDAIWELIGQMANNEKNSGLLKEVLDINMHVPPEMSNAVIDKQYSYDNTSNQKAEAEIVPNSQNHFRVPDEFTMTDESNSITANQWTLTPAAIDNQLGSTEPEMQFTYSPTFNISSDATSQEDISFLVEKQSEDFEFSFFNFIKNSYRVGYQ